MGTLNEYVDRMSKQALFNKVKNHLLTQNKRSIQKKRKTSTLSNGCAYRGDGGLKCAAGAIIPDKFYYEALEGRSAYQIFRGSKHVDFIERLQNLHDENSPSRWRGKLNKLAKEFKLKP